MFDYLVKEEEFLPAKKIDEKALSALGSDIRREILREASKNGVTSEDLVDEMGLDQQTSYYHLRKLEESGLIKSEGKRPKRYSVENTAYYFRPSFVESEDNPLILENVPDILKGFIENRRIKARLVVGAPYPHGPNDRRHKTSYKAGEIAASLGNYGRKRGKITYTDTEIESNESIKERPLISIAGPLVNTFSEGINSSMPARFTESYDRIKTERNVYSSDEIGMVARTEINGVPRILAAGLFGLGTSAAIEAISNRPNQLGEKGAIVRGFGTKQKVEEVEIVEKL